MRRVPTNWSKERKNRQTKDIHRRTLESKKYYCKHCKVTFRSAYDMRNHLKTKKHEKMKRLFP